MTTEDAVQMLANSAGLRISSKGFSQANLVQVAMNAKRLQRPLTIVVATSMTQENLCQIASNGGGTVTFDFVG